MFLVGLILGRFPYLEPGKNQPQLNYIDREQERHDSFFQGELRYKKKGK